MIPASIRELYANQINWMHRKGASPLYWDFGSGRLLLAPSIRKWMVSVVAMFAYLSYLWFRLIQTSRWKISSSEYNLLVVMFTLSSFVHSFQIFLIVRYNEVIVTLNSSLKFYSQFEDKFGKRGTVEPRSMGLLLAKGFISIQIYVVKAAAVSWGLIAGFFPYELIAPPSLLPDGMKVNTTFNAFFGSLYGVSICWLGITCGGQMIVTANSLILVAIGYILCEDQLRVGKKGDYWTKVWLRTPMNLRKTMDSLTIIVRLVHNAAQDFVMVVQMMMTRTVHLCCYLLIRHYHDMKLAHISIISGMMIVMMVSVLGFMQGCALVHTSSTKIIRSLRKCVVITQRERIIWNKIRRSIKPLGIKVGSCFIVKPITVVGIAENYFKGTIRLLLTFSKKR